MACDEWVGGIVVVVVARGAAIAAVVDKRVVVDECKLVSAS